MEPKPAALHHNPAKQFRETPMETKGIISIEGNNAQEL